MGIRNHREGTNELTGHWTENVSGGGTSVHPIISLPVLFLTATESLSRDKESSSPPVLT